MQFRYFCFVLIEEVYMKFILKKIANNTQSNHLGNNQNIENGLTETMPLLIAKQKNLPINNREKQTTLPSDIWLNIALSLPMKDLMSLSRVNKQFYKLLNDDNLWESMGIEIVKILNKIPTELRNTDPVLNQNLSFMNYKLLKNKGVENLQNKLIAYQNSLNYTYSKKIPVSDTVGASIGVFFLAGGISIFVLILKFPTTASGLVIPALALFALGLYVLSKVSWKNFVNYSAHANNLKFFESTKDKLTKRIELIENEFPKDFSEKSNEVNQQSVMKMV